MRSKVILKRKRFKSYEELERSVLEGKTILYQAIGYYLDVVYRKQSNSLCLMKLDIGTYHEIWQIGKRSKQEQDKYPLREFLEIENKE